jgi:hypothetical protein
MLSMVDMKWHIILQDNNGKRIRVVLDNWGAAHDRFYRRWSQDHNEWRCEETGEIAHRAGFLPARSQMPK